MKLAESCRISMRFRFKSLNDTGSATLDVPFNGTDQLETVYKHVEMMDAPIDLRRLVTVSGLKRSRDTESMLSWRVQRTARTINSGSTLRSSASAAGVGLALVKPRLRWLPSIYLNMKRMLRWCFSGYVSGLNDQRESHTLAGAEWICA